MDIGNIFSNLTTKVSGFFNKASTATPTAVNATTKSQTVSSTVPLPARKPSVPAPTTSTVPTNGFNLNTIGNILGQVTNVAEKGIATYFGTKSTLATLKTAQSIEETKLKAITASAQNAPAAAQIMLPSFNDWLANPREAASMVTPAALAGSGIIQSGISSIAMIGGIGVIAYLVIKKAG